MTVRKGTFIDRDHEIKQEKREKLFKKLLEEHKRVRSLVREGRLNKIKKAIKNRNKAL